MRALKILGVSGASGPLLLYNIRLTDINQNRWGSISLSIDGRVEGNIIIRTASPSEASDGVEIERRGAQS